MAALLIFILIIVIIFAIVPKFLSALSSRLTQLVYKSHDKEHQLKEELKTLQNELRSISMVDEFPKYARTERKIQKLKSEYQLLGQNRAEIGLKMKLGLNVTYYVLQGVVFITLMLNFHYDPVIVLPSEWLFPIGALTSFPTSVSGAISTAIWIVVCRSAVGKVAQFL